MNNLHAIIFAYRSNPALRELTQHRNTCSIPYGGRYRLIDFMLSNMVNAGVTDVGLIVHASYQSLLDHVGSGKDWDLSRKHGGLRILPPFGYADKRGKGEYAGLMEALSCVRSYLENIHQEYVILAGGDVVANLPVADILRQHIRTGADITAVCSTAGRTPSRESTYLKIGAKGAVTDVSIRPAEAEGCESIEVFVLSKSLLASLVNHCGAHNIASFSEGVLLGMLGSLRVVPYLFDGYCARIHSVPAYFAHNMDLLDPANRRDLFHPDRPIITKDQSNPSTYYGPDAASINSLMADGCIIEGEVTNSILFRGVRVDKGARVSNCILMQGTSVGQDATLQYTITDKNVIVSPGRTFVGQDSYPVAIAKNVVV